MAARDSEQYVVALDDLLRVIARGLVRKHLANRMPPENPASAAGISVGQQPALGADGDVASASGLAHPGAGT